MKSLNVVLLVLAVLTLGCADDSNEKSEPSGKKNSKTTSSTGSTGWLQFGGRVQSEELQTAHQPQRLVLAHYMPWFAARPVSQVWGWHWTMNAFDPETMKEGKRQIASQYYPLVGPYDSNDADVLEYHLLLMKLSGIDGVIVDWYGLTDLHDYKILHRNTKHLVEQVTRLGMKFAICYEDQTIPALEKAGRLSAEDRVTHVKRELVWMADNWFKVKSYVRLEGRSVLLSFGQSGLTE
jgi:hypothetical protein